MSVPFPQTDTASQSHRVCIAARRSRFRVSTEDTRRRASFATNSRERARSPSSFSIAQFHGTVNTEAQSNGHRLAPYGLVGTFEHSFDSGYVAGAFGTECDGGNCVKND